MAASPKQRPGLYLSLRTTLEWAQELTAPGGASAPLPLSRLAELRRIAPRTLREHLARLEELGLVTRVYAGHAGLSLRIAPVEPDADRGNGHAGKLPSPTAASVFTPPVSDQVLESVALLTRAGVYPQLARSLARKPWVTPDLIAAWVHELRHIRAVRALAAVLVHTLQYPERCLPTPETRADDRRRPASHQSEAEEMRPGARLTPGGRTGGSGGLVAHNEARAVREDQAAGYQAIPAERAMPEHLEHVTLSHTAAGPARLGARVATHPLDHGALWEIVHQALASRLPAEMDALWLRRASPLSLSDGVLVVAVPTTIGAEWLNLAGTPRARDAIQQAVGSPMLVRFVPAGLREQAAD